MPSFWPGADSPEPACRRVAWRRTEKDGKRAPCQPAFARLIEQYRPQLEAYEGLCEDLGETLRCGPRRGSCRILSLPLH